MARIYNGFNALAIGNGINNTQNNILDRRITGINALGGSLQDFARAMKEEEEKEAQKQSAIDFLMGNGMSVENATSLANSGIAPGELALYMQGRLDKASDTEASNKREDYIYGRNRSDSLFDKEDERAYKEGLEEKIFNRDRSASIEDNEYNALNTRYQTLLAKAQTGALMSQSDVDELNSVKQQINDWLAKHPNYTPMSFPQGGNGQGAVWTDKAATDSLYSLIESDGKVDPKKLKDLDERYLRETGRSLAKDLPELYKNIAQKQRGSKTKRKAENPNSGNVNTEEDAAKAWANAQEAARLNKLLDDVKQALINGAGYPLVSEADKKLLEYKDKATMGQYNRIMSRNKGR